MASLAFSRLHYWHTLVLLCINFTWAWTCFEQIDPRDPASRLQVDCSPTRHLLAQNGSRAVINATIGNNDTAASATFTGLRSPLQDILADSALPAPAAKQTFDNMFDFTVNCDAATSHTTCQQVNNTMFAAGQLISNVLALSAMIYVNVTLFPFCQAAQICSNGTESLAAAAPARTIALIDDDDVQRLYPQSVVKQFANRLSTVPQFSSYDINLNVNSDAPFYYPLSSTGIKSSQTDLLYVVLHELFHGLGFTSSYEDYFHPLAPTTLSPNVLISTEPNSNITFSGFLEYAFDRRLAFQHNSVTDLVASMNQDFLLATSNCTFSTADELAEVFEASLGASRISKSLLSNFTTPHTTSFTSANDNLTSLITLETSIVPFSSGSSISHMASDLYANTPDFLMRFISLNGLSLNDTLIRLKKNGAPDIDIYGAIGPGLRGVMASLGYRVRGLDTSTLTTSKTSTTRSNVSTTATNGAPQSRFSIYILSLAFCAHMLYR